MSTQGDENTMIPHDSSTRAPANNRSPILRRELSPIVLLAARSLAVAFVVVELLLYFRWLPRWLDLRLAQAARTSFLLGDNLPYAGAVWAAAALGMVAMSAWCAMAFLILWRRSRDLFGILLFVGFASAGVIESTDVVEIIRLQQRDPWAAPFPLLIMYIANALCVFWVYVFPDGRFVPKWAAVFATAWIGWNILMFTFYILNTWPSGLRADVVSILFALVVVGLSTIRYLKYSSEIQRNQLKWLLLCALVVVIVYATLRVSIGIPGLQRTGPGFLMRVGSTALLSLALIAIPAAMFIAIFRQGLLDVEQWISRTLLYAAMTVIIVTAFFLINAGLARVMQVRCPQD